MYSPGPCQTKRGEDAAYCLLGIFSTHMPLIYGEGRQSALKRLQKEIKESLNDTLFHVPPKLPISSDDSFRPQDPSTQVYRFRERTRGQRFVSLFSITLSGRTWARRDCPRVSLQVIEGIADLWELSQYLGEFTVLDWVNESR
ncbi:hypothetical protein DM02DRAFT_367928 [Periconia macrospinosa]|uniref:Uncharacterized protein n=1 Tax=Periconia macrospinosa TaxID=97972 RepID=A0A2V1CZF7_9PLEO|nr:hypothetical protein DM02DRAFT_367928 [Periconia macrospinosa]